MEQQIANLPPMALISFGAVLAVIFAVRYLGLLQGQKSSPTGSQTAAQVAAVVVDPTALNRASMALEAHTEALRELTEEVHDGNRNLKLLATETDRIREELRIHREIGRR
jgi:hypothetical protein